METKLLNGNNKEAIAEASKILQDGGLVAFPTETVYGLGADALNADAAAKIYAAKGRPSDNPLIVHIADTDAVEKLADLETMNRTHPDMVKKAHMLMEAFWPGPLTIIFPKLAIVPDGTTADRCDPDAIPPNRTGADPHKRCLHRSPICKHFRQAITDDRTACMGGHGRPHRDDIRWWCRRNRN